ncbi:ankyrin repeat-containing domain protein [Biscogniauxia mediterranea]|nr:ankyrin repeat-containing domain protein [Biscogniauxia mediterranea]
MDPLSIIASTIGLVGFTAKTTQEVIKIISDIRDAPSDLLDVRADLENLDLVLRSTECVFTNETFKPRDAVLFETLSQCTNNCKTPVSALHSILQQLTIPDEASTRSKLVWYGRWMLLKNDVRSQRARLREAKASLNLIVSVSNGYLTGKCHDDIQQDIEVLYERIGNDFLSRKKAKVFREKLEEDLRTVTGGSRSPSITAQTDSGYAMDLFLDNLDDAEIEPLQADAFPAEQTTLLDAVAAGNSKRVQSLLSAGASLTDRYDNGMTILHHCALYDEREIATIFLDHGGNINAKDGQDHITPFQLAIREQSWGVAELLVSRGCALGGMDSERLLCLLREHARDISSIKPFLGTLKDRMKIGQYGHDVVSEATDMNDFRSLEHLLEAGFDPNTPEKLTNILPIHRAVLFRNIACLRLLLKHGADPNAYLSPTVLEFLQRDDKCHNKLREFKHPRGITPVTLCTNTNEEIDLSMMELLLKNGADPNFVYEPTQSILLHSLCAKFWFDHAKLMIEHGANVNYFRSTDSTTPLHWAIVCENLVLVELLLDQGADPNLPCPTPPLHQAIDDGQAGIAILLVTRGARLDVRNERGQTPLENAQKSGQHAIADVIRQAGG